MPKISHYLTIEHSTMLTISPGDGDGDGEIDWIVMRTISACTSSNAKKSPIFLLIKHKAKTHDYQNKKPMIQKLATLCHGVPI